MPIPSLIYHGAYSPKINGFEKYHPFKLDRFKYIYENLIQNKITETHNVFVPHMVDGEDLELIHTRNYLTNLINPEFVAKCLEIPDEHIDFDTIYSLVESFGFMTGGTVMAIHMIESRDLVINLGGGFHHAKPDQGEGFCIFNDIAIAIKSFKKRFPDKKILVVDLDAHQGNGTIVCMEGCPSVVTFSMHDEGAYPHPKEKGSYDYGLGMDVDDKEYLRILHSVLPKIIDDNQPDLVFYVAGCDVLEDDHLSVICMTTEGVMQRDEYVINQCQRNNIPVIMTLSGGYSDMAAETQYHSIKNIMRKF